MPRGFKEHQTGSALDKADREFMAWVEEERERSAREHEARQDPGALTREIADYKASLARQCFYKIEAFLDRYRKTYHSSPNAETLARLVELTRKSLRQRIPNVYTSQATANTVTSYTVEDDILAQGWREVERRSATVWAYRAGKYNGIPLPPGDVLDYIRNECRAVTWIEHNIAALRELKA